MMVLSNHYSGRCPGIAYTHGLYDDGNLVGCVIYSTPASGTLCRGVCGADYSNYVVELSRLVVTTTVPNAASILVGRSLSMLPDHIVVSYADCNEYIGHVGYVYQATNWLYTGHGSAEPMWVHPVTKTVVSYTRRHIDKKAENLGLNWKELIKIPQVGKHRYVYFTGNKRFVKVAKKYLKYPILPYPKGETKRHFTNKMQVVDWCESNNDDIPPRPTKLR